QLQILEVEGRLTRFRLAVGNREALEQLLQQRAVARGSLVERGLLHRAPCLLVRERAVGADLEVREVEQPVGPCVAIELREQLHRGLVVERGRSLAQLLDAREHVDSLAYTDVELAARRAQRLVDAGEHLPQAGCTV